MDRDSHLGHKEGSVVLCGKLFYGTWKVGGFVQPSVSSRFMHSDQVQHCHLKDKGQIVRPRPTCISFSRSAQAQGPQQDTGA